MHEHWQQRWYTAVVSVTVITKALVPGHDVNSRGQPTSSSLPVGEKWSGEEPLIYWCSAPHDNWGHKELFRIASAAFGRDLS